MIKFKDPEDSKYKFNSHGVCTNPDDVSINSGKVFSYHITVAKNPMGWDAGYRYQISYGPEDLYTTGISGAFRYQACQKRDVAIIDKIGFILEQFEEALKEHPIIKKWIHEIDPLLELLASFDPDHYQIKSFKKYTMAKTTKKAEPAAVPATSHIVENIPLEHIHASKSNPRKTFDKTYIAELADSMKPPIGLLQPITLRKNEKGYEIAFGECRYRAAKLLKWETIPAIIKDIADDELLALQIIENLQREDVNPIDEAVAFKTLLKTENIEWLASRIHKTKKYIVDRLKLNELIPDAVDQVRKGVLPIGHAVVISKLSYADQKKCLDKVIDNGFGANTDDDYCKVPLEELKDFIAYEVMTDFDKVNFNPNDAELYPTAGACSNCPKRTCNNNLLFHDITKDDKCTDASCFHEKINLHVAREKENAKEEYGKVLSGEKDAYDSGRIKVQGVSIKYSETPTKNAIPVVITKAERYKRNELGTTVYVDSKVLEASKTSKEKAKEENQSSGNSRSNSMTWEQRKLLQLEELWPMLEKVNTMINPVQDIIDEFLRDELDSRSDRILIAYAAINGLGETEGLNSAKEVCAKRDLLEDEGGYFDYRKKVIDAIIKRYSIQEVIMISMLLKRIDEMDENPIDHTEEYGYSWKEMMALIFPMPESPKKSTSKKSTK